MSVLDNVTQGTWVAVEDTVQTEGGVWILPHIHDSWEGNRSFPQQKRQEANAKLFAASKDLYAALQDLVKDESKDFIPTRKWEAAKKALHKAKNGGLV